MTPREGFKFGVMAKLADAGHVTIPQMLEALHQGLMASIQKQAIPNPLSDAADKAWEAAKAVGSTTLAYGIPLALAAPPIAGYIGGGILGKMTDVQDYTPTDAKRDELIETYKQQADRVRRSGALAQLQRAADAERPHPYNS